MPGRTCTICTNPARAEIDMAVAAGTSFRAIACQFKIGRMAITRHVQDGHVAESVKMSQAAKDEKRTIDVDLQLQVINNAMLKILQQSMADKKMYHTAMAAADRLHKQFEIVDKRGKMGLLEEEVLELREIVRLYREHGYS